VNFSPPRGFFRFEFPHKNIVSLFPFYVVVTALYLHSKLFLSLMVWIDCLIIRSIKSSPQVGTFIEI